MPWKRKTSSNRRSKFEDKFELDLNNRGIRYTYESKKIQYQRKPAIYTPDFIIGTIIIETKGRFLSSDRTKHLLIKAQHPELDIRFVFQRAANPIRKGSKTTYADWCNKYGFKWAEGTIPQEWLEESK